MKCLLAALLIPLLYAEIAFGFGEHPEAYCIKKHQNEDFDCLVHCKFKHYIFTDDQYNIRDYHIRNLADFLIKYNVVAAKKRGEVEKHLRSCVESSRKKAGGQNCESIFKYYTCITDERLIFFNKYDDAIKLYDKTFTVVTRS
uniref:14.4 kDa salivary protein n=1 Tax=Phlebotomus duboscqi TaxID=37738 RepID=Q06K50_PHLDU|nr:14.6 kDa salivary protein [Phlebotomus duboscqi]ABI20173.1 14.4 kDa salivary protein [Phlebotomus duboscqi]